MRQFYVGDRVEVIDDIGHHYQSHVGIVTKAQHRAMAVAEEFDVRLADGTDRRFFDFQLGIPPAVSASIVFDSSTSPSATGSRSSGDTRHLQFAAKDFDLHINIEDREGQKTILGQLNSPSRLAEQALLTLIAENELRQTAAADLTGEFRFERAPIGNLTCEIFLPGLRIIAALSV
jgi:hypothetical protein